MDGSVLEVLEGEVEEDMMGCLVILWLAMC